MVVLLLQNFLIAYMGEAYEDTKEKAQALWCYQQFKMIEERAKRDQIKERAKAEEKEQRRQRGQSIRGRARSFVSRRR